MIRNGEVWIGRQVGRAGWGGVGMYVGGKHYCFIILMRFIHLMHGLGYLLTNLPYFHNTTAWMNHTHCHPRLFPFSLSLHKISRSSSHALSLCPYPCQCPLPMPIPIHALSHSSPIRPYTATCPKRQQATSSPPHNYSGSRTPPWKRPRRAAGRRATNRRLREKNHTRVSSSLVKSHGNTVKDPYQSSTVQCRQSSCNK